MKLLKTSLPESPRAERFPIYRGPEEVLAGEMRAVGLLVNDWLMAREMSRPLAARRSERVLHEAIKSGLLYRKILSFAGLNLWVDDRTPDGFVEIQESISL